SLRRRFQQPVDETPGDRRYGATTSRGGGAMPLMSTHFAASTSTRRLPAWTQPILAVIGPNLHGGNIDASTRSTNYGVIAALCLTAAVALLLVVAGHGAGRRGDESMAMLLFWSGVVLL